ncbi:ABC transporter substrate-binding protein [Pseudorhodoplanes sp.]|uniref:ABC transporter substrate-binding protein n=1 Tax=Pseudorhodoplanes sp. TaxID=1934341 RepID=UPI003D0B37DA
MKRITRRTMIAGTALSSTAAFLPFKFAIAQNRPIKLGVMLPYSGTFARLGKNIDDGLRMALKENGNKLGGRDVEYIVLDDESNPAKGAENANKLVARDKVDCLIGSVHSGVAMAMVKVARDTNTMLIIPNAGVDTATGEACAPNIFRTSFSNWQVSHPMGTAALGMGHKRAVGVSWQYAAGQEQVKAFAEGFASGGGKIEKEIYLPFPAVEFQAILTEIAGIKPDVVYAFFAGGGAAKFVKDFAASGLGRSMQLVGSGFLTDGTLEAQGDSAEGLQTTLHYGDELEIPKNISFRNAFKANTGRDADVYAVQGYDTGQLLLLGANAVGGDFSAKQKLIQSMESATIDSPRGAFTFSKSHNPIQDIYLRKVVGLSNKVIGVAAKAVVDPARGCSMAT